MRGEWFEWSDDLAQLIDRHRATTTAAFLQIGPRNSGLADLAPKVAQRRVKLRAV
jgi:hypothetical protein